MLRFWGHMTVRRGFYEDSVEAFSRAIRLVPDSVDAHLVRGLLYWRELQDARRAIADFSAVLRLDPTCSEALFYRGMAYQAQGDYAAAAADLRAAIEQAPGAIWRENAYDQLIAIEAILDDLAVRLGGVPDGLLPAGTEQSPPDGTG